LTGSEGLIALRGRNLSVRPFEVVQAMEQDAELRYRTKEQELLERIEATQQKIRQLQEEERQSGVILTAEQQAEIDDFRTEMIGLRQELRTVQRSLREDVEQLSFWVRGVNTWAVPILIGMVAIVLALVRRWRAHRFAHGH
jgi:cell division protein FtsX